MSAITEWKSGTWRRKRLVGTKCDVCGRTARGRAPFWWRVNLWPAKGPRRQRLRGLRRLDLCSARCLLRKLDAAHAGRSVGLRFSGSARMALRGLTFGPARTPPRMTPRRRLVRGGAS